MKKLMLLIGTLTCSFAATARDGRNELEEHNLKGKIKQVRAREYFVDNGDTSLKGDRISTYDIHGNAICDSDCLDTGWLLHFENRYDDKGRISEKQQLDGATRKKDWRTTYTYDTKGQLKETNRYKAEGELMQRVVFFYDARGRNIKQVSYGPNGKQNGSAELTYNDKGVLVQEVNYGGFYGEDALHDRVAYDDKGNMSKRVDYDGKHKANKEQTFTHTNSDSYGNHLTTTQTTTLNGRSYVMKYRFEITYY